MSERLTGVFTKLQRAEEHLQTLEAEIAVFQRRKPYEFTNDLKSEPGNCLLRFHLLEEPRNRWAVIAGDIAHNLRSALDHIAWQLVKENGGSTGWQTKFPIYREEPDYTDWRTPRPPSDPRGKWSDPFDGVDERVIAAIEDFQPFKPNERWDEAEDHPLAVLNAISNRDKHRLLAQMFAGLDGTQPVVGLTFVSEGVEQDAHDNIALLRDQPWIDDGSILMRGTVSPGATEPKMSVQGNLALDVTFGQGRLLLLPTLNSVRTFIVEEVVPSLRHFV